MPDIIKDTRYLRTKEAAHYVGLSARTLEKHRTYGTGPAYLIDKQTAPRRAIMPADTLRQRRSLLRRTVIT